MKRNFVVVKSKHRIPTAKSQIWEQKDIIQFHKTHPEPDVNIEELARFDTLDEAKSYLQKVEASSVQVRERGSMYFLYCSIISIMHTHITDADPNTEYIDDFSDFKAKTFCGREKSIVEMALEYNISIEDIAFLTGIPYYKLRRWAYGESEIPEHMLYLIYLALRNNKG